MQLDGGIFLASPQPFCTTKIYNNYYNTHGALINIVQYFVSVTCHFGVQFFTRCKMKIFQCVLNKKNTCITDNDICFKNVCRFTFIILNTREPRKYIECN